MRIARRTLALLALSSTLLMAACQSDDSSSSTDAASTDETVQTESVAPDETTDDATAETTADATGALPVLADGEAPPERTFTISESGISPASVEIAVGDNVTFVGGDSGVYAIEVGVLDQATVTGGLFETFEFPEPGTYIATEVLSGNTVTITVG